ncbi:hypothetical protein QTP70_006490, partial [Hemibagrus guttatus]
MILTSAERSDSGTYTTLTILNVDQRSKGSYSLQVTIEAQVSSVKLSYSCLPTGVMKVNCSADGDNLHFSWSSDFNALPQLENGTSTVILEQDHQGKVTCHVENHISRDNNSVDLHQCPAQVSSVNVSYSCLTHGVVKVNCSADGDNLHFSWTSDFNALPQLENGTSTVILEQDHQGKVTCHVENHISRDNNSVDLHQCPAQVSSVNVSYSCLTHGVVKVNCSADGDNLHFSWTSDFNALPQLENGTSTVILEQDHQGKVTCHVKNHISRDNNSVDLHQCPAQVSSVNVSYSCLTHGVVKVNCSADGDNLHFSWTSDFNALPQLENGTSTVILEQDHQGKVTCHVENHISRDNNSVDLHQCPAQVSSVNVSYSCLTHGVVKVNCSADGDNLHFIWTSDFNALPQLENGTSTVILEQDHQGKVTCHVENHISRDNNSVDLHQCPDAILLLLSMACVILIILAVLAFCIYKKRQGRRRKANHVSGIEDNKSDTPSQDDKDLVYAEVTHIAMNRTKTRP